MPSQPENRKKIAEECKGTASQPKSRQATFLGASICDGQPTPEVFWYSRSFVIAEILRWMAHVSFNSKFQREDCEELFDLFNIRSGTEGYLSDEKTIELQNLILEFIKEDLLKALEENGVIRNGTWDVRAKRVWAQDNWDYNDMSLENLEKAFPSLCRMVPEYKYSDVLENEQRSKAEYEAAKQMLDSIVERHGNLFSDFREQALKMDGDEDRRLAQLRKTHEELVSEHVKTTRLMLQNYCTWQLCKTDRKILKKKFSGQ
ncbi:uncharacterized protein IWZ02DRAFT_437867 [Phyllosticta citriasiana]|uniref:uncharacterized protein n=1 Tax=Phyllosticta citriasiana TaxID=595635 RepID=UPI0030FD5BF5